MSPGNLQYHFAKKDDLVAALVGELHAANNARMAEVEAADVSFETVFELTVAASSRHIAYRGVILSYAEVVSKSPELLALAKEMDAMRPARMRRFVDLLADNGYLDRKRIRGRITLLRELGEGLGRFWLLHAVLRGEGDDLEAAAERHARRQLVLWEPYATKKGRAQIAKITGVR